MLNGVLVTPLKVFSDKRGSVLRMLRSDDKIFFKFGEIYFSQVNPNHIKGWHCHRSITQNFAVPSGNARFVLYDDREHSNTYKSIDQCELGTGNYALLTVPPGIWYGFSALGEAPALIANCIPSPFDPNETKKRDIEDPSIPFKWAVGPESCV